MPPVPFQAGRHSTFQLSSFPCMPDSIRCGVFFKSATRSAPVASFFKTLGLTRLDTSPGPQKGFQTYWFPSVAEFNKQIVGIIETVGKGAVHYPIPVFQVLELAELAPVAEEKPQGSQVVRHETHNLGTASSNLAPATHVVKDTTPPPADDNLPAPELPVEAEPDLPPPDDNLPEPASAPSAHTQNAPAHKRGKHRQ